MKNTPLTSISTRSKSDLFGVLASSLCMIHCLATPFIFVVQACSASCCEAGPWWWRIIDYLFLVISIIAIHYSSKTTKLNWMPTALYIGWGILAFLIINERFQFLAIPHTLVYLPAFTLVYLHIYNQRYCQCNHKECCVVEPRPLELSNHSNG